MDHAKALLITKSFSVLTIHEPRYLKFSTMLTIFNSDVFVKLNAISSFLLEFKQVLFLTFKSFWACSISSEIREILFAKLSSV